MHSPPLNSISCNSLVIAITFPTVAIVKPHSCSPSHERWLTRYLNQNGAAADWNCSNKVEKSDPLEVWVFFFNFKSLEISWCAFSVRKVNKGKKACPPVHLCYKHIHAREPETESCGHSSMFTDMSSRLSLFPVWYLRHDLGCLAMSSFLTHWH